MRILTGIINGDFKIGILKRDFKWGFYRGLGILKGVQYGDCVCSFIWDL